MIIHIPHSSTKIPDATGFIDEKLVKKEMTLLTDWYTDEIFNVNGISRIVTPWSRLFCDVERFADDAEEPMAAVGRGVVYAKTHDQKQLRMVNDAFRNRIIRKYYYKHHSKLMGMVNRELRSKNRVLILDAHSFPPEIRLPEYDGMDDFSDFCIGTDPFHTPPEITMKIYRFFKDRGFNVSIDKPYSGTIVPLKYYHKDSRVKSVMIEVNRKLYLKNCHSFLPERSKQFKVITQMIQKLITILSKGE